MTDPDRTAQQFQRAREVMPGGVNSSTRVNQALGHPVFARSTHGSRVTDIDGREFVDMSCAHGAALLGHAHPAIDEAVRQAMEIGYASMFETEFHERLAREVCDIVPCAERVRFCSSGSEATLHLLRACRAHTGRDKIMRIEGHFHGYHELTYIGGHPPSNEWPRNRKQPYVESAGIPQLFAQLIVPIPFNDPTAFLQAIDQYGDETAVVILEPVNWNWGGIVAEHDYLQLLREVTRDKGIVLFFDEIQSLYKTQALTAQREFGVTPDVASIGKSLGGGFPLSAFCGQAAIMDRFMPVGDVQHSGTFNAPLISVLTALAMIRQIREPDFYPTLQSRQRQFHDGFDALIERMSVNMVVPHHGARFNLIFGRRTPGKRYEDLFCHDRELLKTFIRGCYDRGVYYHDYGGGPFHHGFSVQHTAADLDLALVAADEVLREMAAAGSLPLI